MVDKVKPVVSLVHGMMGRGQRDNPIYRLMWPGGGNCMTDPYQPEMPWVYFDERNGKKVTARMPEQRLWDRIVNRKKG